MRGCDYVFHLAAPTREIPGLSEIVIGGTKNILSAAAATGVSCVVYTSSIVTIGYSNRPAEVLDESSRQISSASCYHSAKYLAESLALGCAQRQNLKVVVVNPATIIGSLDFRTTPSSQPLEMALSRRLRFTFDSGVTVAPVRDVARGHILALRNGRSGERYILGGERLTISEYFDLINKICGTSKRLVRLPRSMMLGVGGAFSALQFLGWRTAPFTYTQALHLVGNYGFYSSDKAIRELGYSWHRAHDAISDYIEWVRAGRPSHTD
jgi:dihydroflavonol-4-reductase